MPDMTPLTHVLLAMTPPSEPNDPKVSKFFDPTLNSSQKEAVRFALGAREVACIHGPPGSANHLAGIRSDLTT